MMKWEYKRLRINQPYKDEFGRVWPFHGKSMGEWDSIGAEGWELVSVINQPKTSDEQLFDGVWGYFKRPIGHR